MLTIAGGIILAVLVLALLPHILEILVKAFFVTLLLIIGAIVVLFFSEAPELAFWLVPLLPAWVLFSLVSSISKHGGVRFGFLAEDGSPPGEGRSISWSQMPAGQGQQVAPSEALLPPAEPVFATLPPGHSQVSDQPIATAVGKPSGQPAAPPEQKLSRQHPSLNLPGPGD